MRVLVIFLLLTICDLSTSIGIYNRENNILQTDFRRSEFFQNIRDWFCNLKNQIYDRLFGQTVTMKLPFSPTEITNLDKFELEDSLRNHKWHLLDLSTLSFDPNQDWGFRVGNWYFIQKGCKDQNELENNSDELDFQPPTTTHPKDSVEVETAESFDITNNPGITESSLITSSMTVTTMHNVTPLTTQQTYPQTTVQMISEEIDFSENSSPKTDTPLQDNETGNDFVHTGSAEVLMG